MQGLERPELLRDQERGVIRQHDPAGADADALGVGGDVRDEHAGRRRRNRWDVVVLGVPDARVAEAFRQLGDRNAALKTVAGGFAGADEGEIENREREAHRQGRAGSRLSRL
jgi:hypothetical protein